ncbi:MAG TPA: protein phosphatase 2C domain-containing protein [Longimicrobiales bacterium]|nr:protein phosphatase 2C domain-containing protein [Longimicrobiales bacterium]
MAEHGESSDARNERTPGDGPDRSSPATGHAPLPLVFRAEARTHVGLLRGSNEDAFAFDEHAGLFSVADGMGGHAGGEIASRVAVACVMEASAPLANGDEQLGRTLFRSAAERAHFELEAHGEEHPELRGLGTTLTALRSLAEGTIQLLHVGDSRAYLYRAGRLTALTTDHSWVFEQLVNPGRLTREQARTHPSGNLISNCVGGGLPDAPVADLIDVPVHAGDRVLLVTDGLTDMLPEAGIAGLCGEHTERSALVDALVQAALNAGGRDNITVMVIDAIAPVDDRALALAS